MSAFTVGRVGLDVELTKVQAWSAAGDGVQVDGLLLAASLADARVLRQQLNGYVNSGDEPTVPVTWSEDPTVDGFYKVTGVQVSTVPMSFASNLFEFSLSLTRVAGYAGPLAETVIVGEVRSNAHGITNANAVGVVGIPDVADEFYDSSDPGGVDVFDRISPEGAVRCVKSSTYTRRQTFSVPPLDWYVGAARIEIGSPYRAVVGQQIPLEVDTWRLSNGLIRVLPDPAGVGISAFNGTGWDPVVLFRTTVGGVSAPSGSLATGLRVLRNSPEECIVRVPVVVSDALLSALLNTGSARIDIDLALRRGERMMRGYFVSTESKRWGYERATAEAATALTGGIRATSDDASGNRYVLSSPQAVTNDLVQGGIELTSADTEFSFAIGLELNGSIAATNDAAQELIYQYMAAHSERVIVGAR